MLILTRKISEEILMTNGVVIKLLSIGRGNVSLGISVNKDVRIVREEIAGTNLINEIYKKSGHKYNGNNNEHSNESHAGINQKKYDSGKTKQGINWKSINTY